MEEQGRPAEGQRRAEEAPLKVTAAEMHLHLLTADLPEEEDVVSSYRRREAAWISLITHAIIIDFSSPLEFQSARHCPYQREAGHHIYHNAG
jgi:hypothetical protein